MNNQFGRKIGLIVFAGEDGLDLSAYKIEFSVQNADQESPNNAVIRVYNLAPNTVKKIRGEFSQVVLNAGYEQGNYGVIFQGTIKQFKVGKLNSTDSFLDILAADGDISYNQGIVSATIAKGETPLTAIETIAKDLPDSQGVSTENLLIDKQHVPSIRGTVLFGMARARLRNLASNLDASWSIQNGRVVFMDNTGYAEGEAVEINIASGQVGFPQQTDEGIKVSCLLNSRLRIGGLVHLNNSEIVQLLQQNPDAAPIPFNQWAGFQPLAPLSPDGFYRAYVVEHEGDTRGNAWYSHITCLAVDRSSPRDKSVSPQ